MKATSEAWTDLKHTRLFTTTEGQDVESSVNTSIWLNQKCFIGMCFAVNHSDSTTETLQK